MKRLFKPPREARYMAWCKMGEHAGYVGKPMPCPGTPEGEDGLRCDCDCHTDPRVSQRYVDEVERKFLSRIIKEKRTDLLDIDKVRRARELGLIRPLRKLKKKGR